MNEAVITIEGIEKEGMSQTGFYIDGYLKDNLDIARKAIKNDWDMCFLIDGTERGGKSVLAMQLASYCDPNFNIDKVCLSRDEFKKTILKAEKYTAIVYDEAFTGLSSRNTMTRINKSIVEMLVEIGQKNLFVFIVCPTFFDLDRYPALWRSRALIHIYTGESFSRGFFRFYGEETKKKLYVFGKKTYDYHCVPPDFYGRFTNHYVIDEAEYRKKKAKSLADKEKLPEPIDDNIHKEWLFNKLNTPEFDNLKELEKAQLLGINPRTFRVWKAKRLIKHENSLENEENEDFENGS
jgi:hypothetical protein